jgi:hypothetical protein
MKYFAPLAAETAMNQIQVMNILQKSACEIWPTRGEYHVLTYAEEGFSPLDMHGRAMGVDKQQQVAFCDSINQRHETETLFPKAPISAVPRAIIRDSQDADALARHIAHFLKINLRTIKATKAICDFRTPRVAPFVVEAIEAAMASPDASIIEEVVIVE